MVWKKYKILTTFVFIAASLFEVKECYLPKWNSGRNGSDTAMVHRDLGQLKKNGKIVLLTENNSTAYFIYRGNPMGYEYETIDSFAHSIGVQLSVVVVRNIDNIFTMLDSGIGDIAADNLTVTNSRRKSVDFTLPLFTTRQVLVQRKPDNWQKLAPSELDKILVRSPIQLADKKVYARKGSSFFERLQALSNEIGGKIEVIEAPPGESAEELIGDVATGKIDYTLADENCAAVVCGYYDNLDIMTPVSFPQKISFAVRNNSPHLQDALNEWIRKEHHAKFLQIVYDKYYDNKKFASLRKNAPYSSISGDKISPYDDLAKKYAPHIGWDWKLLVAQIYQESQFDPHAQSWSGAYGLMQTLPSTSNIDSADMTPEKSIAAGVQYLKTIDDYWAKSITDEKERIAFDLASYDVGIGHVIDAQNLAAKYALNPEKWENNVAYFLLNESKPKYYNDAITQYGYCRGQEAFQYVREIMNRYEMYCNIYGKPDDNMKQNGENLTSIKTK